MQLFLRGREPSQSSHSFACKQAKRDIFALQKVGFFSPTPHTPWLGVPKIKIYKPPAGKLSETAGALQY